MIAALAVDAGRARAALRRVRRQDRASRRRRPRSHDKYELGIGKFYVDLSDLALAKGRTQVKTTLGIGNLHVIVPRGVAVAVDARAGAETSSSSVRDDDGTSVTPTSRQPGTDLRECSCSTRTSASDASTRAARLSTSAPAPAGRAPARRAHGARPRRRRRRAGIGDALAVDPTLVRLDVRVPRVRERRRHRRVPRHLGAAAGARRSRRRRAARRIAGTVLLVWSAILALRGARSRRLARLAARARRRRHRARARRNDVGLGAARAQLTRSSSIVAGVVVFVGRQHGRQRVVARSLRARSRSRCCSSLGPWGFRLVRERDAERAARVRRRSVPSSRRACTIPCCRRSTLIQKDPDDARRSRAGRSASCARGSTPTRGRGRRDARRRGRVGRRRDRRAARRPRRASCAPATRRSTSARRRWCSRRARRWRTQRACGRRRGLGLPRRRRRRRLALRARPRRGFDPDAIAADRQGSRSRSAAGWSAWAAVARIVSAPGEGTEVELELAMSMPLRRVVLVDDHDLFRAGVRGRARRRRSRSSARRRSVAEAVPLIKELDPDVVLLDVHLPDGGGHAVIMQVAPDRPGVKFLALSVSDAAEDVIDVIRAGARGYVTKAISGEELTDAVHRAADGDAVFSPRLAGFVLDAFRGGEAVGRPRARPAHLARARGAAADRARLHATRRSRRGCTSRRAPSSRTCRRCCASCSSRTGTS